MWPVGFEKPEGRRKGVGLAFPPQVGAGCVFGREGLNLRTRVRGLSESPGSIGFDSRLNGKKNTGVTNYEPQ
ncbi:hypothetical protein E4198_17050 [Streptomyces sp. RKND-216]|nr:hypothetical protein E4198_17050 [Streptomyces sp. RKND-216]